MRGLMNYSWWSFEDVTKTTTRTYWKPIVAGADSSAPAFGGMQAIACLHVWRAVQIDVNESVTRWRSHEPHWIWVVKNLQTEVSPVYSAKKNRSRNTTSVGSNDPINRRFSTDCLQSTDVRPNKRSDTAKTQASSEAVEFEVTDDVQCITDIDTKRQRHEAGDNGCVQASLGVATRTPRTRHACISLSDRNSNFRFHRQTRRVIAQISVCGLHSAVKSTPLSSDSDAVLKRRQFLDMRSFLAFRNYKSMVLCTLRLWSIGNSPHSSKYHNIRICG